MNFLPFRTAAAAAAVCCSAITVAVTPCLPAHAQAQGAPTTSAAFAPLPAFPLATETPLAIRGAAQPNHPFTVTGLSGAILGMQDGTVELWQLPVKLFSGLHLQVEIDGYPVPIDLNPLAAELAVYPDHTTLTYAHAAVTVRQHMFVPAGQGNEGLGGMIFFEIEAIHPVTLTVSLAPSLAPMWPAPQWGQPGWDWTALGTGGAYSLGTDNPELFGMIAMPNASPGADSPYQEHPRTLPLAFRVHYDPAHDRGHFFPLVCETGHPGERNDAGGQAALRTRVLSDAAALPAVYARTRDYYAHFFDTRTTVHTPDPAWDRALAWAELAIDKAQASTRPTAGSPRVETALVAGWYPAFDGERPGFGWFFGRDSLWSMYAIDSYGDAALARREFEFLLRRQRADGKVMHEYSQTADELTGNMAWSKLPYEYAAADATPLLLLAMEDYVRATGDTAFLGAHWAEVERAYRFESTHDSDGDGVYDNAEGTGWVESWPPKMPHQELYLAALDRDATEAAAQLATWAGHPELATQAQTRAAKLRAAVAAYKLPSGLYAFSQNADHTFDPTQTIYPAVALWASGEGLPNAAPTLRAWSSAHFATDWGTRALADTESAYDPIAYHQGTVWPLFTGWNAMAQYRSGHPLAGFAALRQNLELTWAQDPGSVTEVLSGRFFEPLGRSSTHQLWSSAMVLAPALRELLGLEPDAVAHTLLVHPHLPPAWDHVAADHVQIGGVEYSLTEAKRGGQLHVELRSAEPSVLCLRAAPGFHAGLAPSGSGQAAAAASGQGAAGAAASGQAAAGVRQPGLSAAEPTSTPACTERAVAVHALDLPLPALELSLAEDEHLPTPGSDTTQPRIVDERTTPHSATVEVEGRAGATVSLDLHRNGLAPTRHVTASAGTLNGTHLQLTLPQGDGMGQGEGHGQGRGEGQNWSSASVTVSW